MEARSLGGLLVGVLVAIGEGWGLLEGLSVGFCEGAHCFNT